MWDTKKKKLISVQLLSACVSNPYRHKQNNDLTTRIRNHANKYSELGTFRHNKHDERHFRETLGSPQS